MKKKIISCLMVGAVLLTLLAGCSSSSAPVTSSDSPVADGKTSTLKIAIVSSPSGVDDGSFNQDNYNGILDFNKEYKGASVTDIKEVDIANSVAAVEDIVADYDVIVTPGFQFADITSVALANPTKKFILVDSFPATEDEQPVANIYAMQFKEQESGFLAGIAAALQTKTGKVAVVNGIAYPSNVNYQYGFEAGVNYANAKLGASAEIIEIASRAGTDVTGANVGGNYTGSFDDETVGKVVGNELIAQGADIIFVAAGGSGNGVFTAAKENGNTLIIGCDVDQWGDGDNNGKNIILTSALKIMRINVYRSLVKIQENTFKGENALLGAESDSVGYVSADGHHQLTADSIKAMDDGLAAIKNGTIVPPSNFSGTTPEDFPGLN
jgi:basic membrane protein A